MKKSTLQLPDLMLEPDGVACLDFRIGIDDLPDAHPIHPARLVDASPLIEKLWRVALADAESNIVRENGLEYFGAGKNFGKIVYTRDISYSGVLGLNWLYPEVMRESLEHTRDVRLTCAWRVPPAYHIPELDAPWQVENLTDPEFLETYHTNNFLRRTDDVVWLWAAEDLIGSDAARHDWQWIHEIGVHCFETLYAPLFDPSDGLYRGQASFIDIHFGHKKSAGYPLDWSISDCIMQKTTSTNCLYYKGMLVMARAAAALGLGEQAAEWRNRAKALRTSILTHLRRSDGTFVFYLDRHGEASSRREALGAALAVLLDVVAGEDALRALAGYPLNAKGVPTFWPFFDDDRCYHNHTSWPFVEAFFLWAMSKASGQNTIPASLALLARSCVEDGTFHEVVDYRNGRPGWSARQLWTAAAFLGACRRGGFEIREG